MKRIAISVVAAGVLAVPSAASARVIELGSNADPAARPTCPTNPCQAITRTTGYQGRGGNARDPFVIRRDGKILAFTISLGRLTAEQLDFFTNDLGLGAPRARISILRKGKRRRTRLDHRLVAQSDVYPLSRYLGSSPTFVFDRPIPVRRGHIVALTVPSWAPALAVGLPKTNWWRSSRRKGACDNVTQRSAHEQLRQVRVFGCTYFRARVLYTVTYVPDPRPTS